MELASKDYTVEVFTNKELPTKLFSYENNRYVHTGSYANCKELASEMSDAGYSVKTYKTSWGRSRNYREKFFKKYKGPYRCAYCGKKLTYKDVTVDHIIPVSKTKNSLPVRLVMAVGGYNGPNDIKNLTCSCLECNIEKQDKITLKYFLQAKTRNHKILWMLKTAIKLMPIVCILILLITNLF